MTAGWLNRAFTALVREPLPAAEAQPRALERILARARSSAFGRHHRLHEVRSIAEYQDHVPVQEYADLEPWWTRAEAGEAHVLSDEPVLYFALTSGTTGRQKRVPITPTFFRNVHAQQRHGLAQYLRRHPESPVLLRRSIVLAGRARISTTPGGIPCGMVSGIIVEGSHPVIRLRSLPTFPTLNEADWDRKLERMIGETRGKQIGFVGGIASAILAFLSRARETMSADEYRRLTADIEVAVTSGVDYRVYRDALFAAIGHPIGFVEMYGASEGFLGYSSPVDPDSFELFTDHIFFELVPLDRYGTPSPPRLLVTQCEGGREYVLAVTNGCGAFSYVLGDVLRCVHAGERPRFRIAGRIHLTLNLVTEKTTVPAVEGTVLELAREMGGRPGEFFVTSRRRDGRPRYVWALEDGPLWRTRDRRWLAGRLDELLTRHNEHYRPFLGTQLDPSEVILVDPARLQGWLDRRGGDQGHRKIPRIVPDSEMVADLIG